MSLFKPECETYQDVKNTLAWWGTPVWAGATMALWYMALLPDHRQAVIDLVPGVKEWGANVGVLAALLALSAFVSQVMVHILEVDDHLYDRYVIKWRDRYAREEMIPELLRPHAGKLPQGFSTTAIDSPRQTLKRLFYPFAADRDARIGQNFLVRFYERITKYWLTQVAEVALLLLAFLTALYAGIWRDWPWPASTAILMLMIILGLFIGNRLLAYLARRSVWEATQAEIQAIHSKCGADFKKALAKLGDEYGFPIDQDAASA